MTPKFDALVSQIAQIGLEHHAATLLENSRCNSAHIDRTIRDVERATKPCLIVSAGPSLYRQRILDRVLAANPTVTVVSTDGAYIQCLKAGIVPDWVVTIDPHPTRIVRWFGDPDWERNSEHDDYFKRQDLDVGFREESATKNAENIELVDRNKTKLAICSASPQNVVARTALFERYWFAPLVDDPDADGLTRQITISTQLPALNTGGTVGTAAWAFAHCVLRATEVAVCGMDYGYPADTPLRNTQEWNLTGGDPELYPSRGDWYTSPTYHWYLGNFTDLLDAADATITNCSEGGLLDGPRVKRMRLEEWLK